MEPRNKIPLRQYYRKIEEKLLYQKSEDALADANYLLQQYPRNLSTYQLVGKILLERQAFDAADTVFEYVLKINPDDFVALLGKSLIAESFGNLEAALRNMQRAYEIQPANENLQNEVKRLMQEKDGFAPDKLRLSRGSLIKMYKRSQLNEQGIAEAKLGIQENPDRVDFQTELAEMLSQEGRSVTAVEIALNVIKIYPFCLPALKILNSTLLTEEAKTKASDIRMKLIEIDPYYAYIKPETKSVENIPDIAIMVDEHSPSPVDENEVISFINHFWESDTGESRQVDIEPAPNWEKMVDEAVQNSGLGEPINENDFEEVKLPDEFIDDIPDLPSVSESELSKKALFKKKLSGVSISKTAPEVPDWLFDDDEKDSDENETLTNISPQEEKPVTPSNAMFDEAGMTDHESSVVTSVEDDLANEWKEETIMTKDTSKSPPTLEDTQRVNVLSEDNDQVFSQAIDNLKKENFPFAYKCLDRLIENNHKLEQLSDELGIIADGFPSEIDLSLYLVKIYNLLGHKEKALKTLQRAQKNINFE